MTAPPTPPIQPAGAGPPLLAKYFRAMAKAGASDLHVKPGAPPHIRVRTEISAAKAASGSPLSPLSRSSVSRSIHGSLSSLPDGSREAAR